MKLLNLTLDNFKATKHYELEPNGSSMDVYGDNDVGKTTLADAYFWLLVGKNSINKSDFPILPTDEDGNIIEGLDASVSGSFLDENSQEFSLRRVYHQVFRRKNGEAEQEVKGNTTDFFINGVPKSMKDYTAFVSGICDEKTFMVLTDFDMFAKKMDWKDRRDILIRLFSPDTDDLAIINSHDELKPLLGYIGFKSVDDYAEITKADRKRINTQLDGIPGRIDEAEKAKPFDAPTADDGPEALRLSKTKIQLESNLQKIRNGESAASLRKKIAELQADISTAKTAYIRKTAGGNTALEAEAATLRSTISNLRNSIAKNQACIFSATGLVDGLTKEIEDLRTRCVAKFAEEMNPTSGRCPTCGREYPPEQIDELRETFNYNKAESLKKLETKGQQLACDKGNLEKSLEEDRQQLQADEQSLKHSESRLEQLNKSYANPPAFETTAEYKKLQDELSAAEHDLSTVDAVAAKQSEKLTAQLEAVIEQIDAIKQRMTSKSIVEQQDKRIAELKAQEKELAQLLATYDNGLLLAEKFVQTKAHDIEQKVNSAFRIVRWKLFIKQGNGGIRACCEATVKGIGYGNGLNTGKEFNAGLDIISTLGHAFGISVPVWIDNAERVTRFLPIDAQLIRLHVSARDKQLRAEVRE